MAETTHYFAARVRDHAELKRTLERAGIPAMLDPCEYPSLGRGKWDGLPEYQRWVLVITQSENWSRLTRVVERLVEIVDVPTSWHLAVSWAGRELSGSFHCVEREGPSTRFSDSELDFLARFFDRPRSAFESRLVWGRQAQFCEAVGIPFLEMVDQDRTVRPPRAGVVYAHEMDD
jgi:hypothetical protein